MISYACTVCSYGYHPLKGDPESGVLPGTPFEDLPDDWRCPWCGATKAQFVPEKDGQSDLLRGNP
ncbi:MAG: rubredoxin [Planctomycetes bacterium]|nr:rubredoxin [Planctomycetota bacterium]